MRSLLLGLLFVGVGVFHNSFAQKQLINIQTSQKIFVNEQEFKEWLIQYKNDTVLFFNDLNNNQFDSIPFQRLNEAFSFLMQYSKNPNSASILSQTKGLLLNVLLKKNENNSSLAIKYLKQIPIVIFSKYDFDSISAVIKRSPSFYKDLVLFAGYTNNSTFIEDIKTVYPNARNYSKPEKWATNVALARLGDSLALDYCVKRVSSLGLGDEVIDILFPDLIYIQKKESFQVIVNALYNNEKLCSSPNPNSDAKIVCGYRIMELLSPAIQDFPIKALPSGDLDINDYQQGLEIAREWFKNIGENYMIINI